MKRRRFLATTAVAAVAGCTTQPIKVVDVDRDIERQDSGVVVQNLEVGSGDTEDCFHLYEGTIINRGNQTLSDAEVLIHVYNRKGRVLSTVTLNYRLLRPEQIQEFEIGVEGDCWDEEEAVDYEVEVS